MKVTLGKYTLTLVKKGQYANVTKLGLDLAWCQEHVYTSKNRTYVSTHLLPALLVRHDPTMLGIMNELVWDRVFLVVKRKYKPGFRYLDGSSSEIKERLQYTNPKIIVNKTYHRGNPWHEFTKICHTEIPHQLSVAISSTGRETFRITSDEDLSLAQRDLDWVVRVFERIFETIIDQ